MRVALSLLISQLVDSNTGPGNSLAQALWHSGDTTNQVSELSPVENNIQHTALYSMLNVMRDIYLSSQVKLLWQDPKMEGWKYETSYAFHVFHRPSIGLIRYKDLFKEFRFF